MRNWVFVKVETDTSGLYGWGEASLEWKTRALVSQHQYREIFEKHACHVIQPDLCHCGGLLAARKIASMAEVYNMAVAPHNPLGPIANAAALHFDLVTPNFIIQEDMLTDVPWRWDVVKSTLETKDGHWLPPTLASASTSMKRKQPSIPSNRKSSIRIPSAPMTERFLIGNPNFSLTTMSQCLKGKTAIVTGAGDGIGRGIAIAFAKQGANVAVCARREINLLETVRLIEAEGVKTYHEAFDIAEVAAIERFVKNTQRTLGATTILVNNAAVMPVVAVEHMTEEQYDLCLDVKFKSAVFFSKFCIPGMRKMGGGSIIHMASVTGNVGFENHAVYGAANAALMGLARGQAMELAPDHIRVNSISPGTVDSPMLHRYIKDSGKNPEALMRSFSANHPRGKVGSIEEVAAVFVFLASEDAANITATDIRCDGGFSFKGGQADVS